MSLFASALLLAAALGQTPSPHSQVDFDGFAVLTQDVRELRAQRLIDLATFQAMAARGEALLLDARSRDAYAAGHIAGAVNLPFTDFTAASLAAAIGPDRDRPILIYCNNNFRNDTPPVPMKARPLALNIQTFINLVGYGYANVWELADLVDFDDPAVKWVRG